MQPMRSGPFLTRLARDTRGNTLAIMAAAIFPLVGLIGGGVDMSRLYLVKTRLQQACDAGALSGRKAMAGGNWTTVAENRADELFRANFAEGAYGTGVLNADFTEDDGVVTGAASVDVPMTLMRVFGFGEKPVSVNCTAKMEIPNTDVMFVLDVTYSMRTDDKIGGLKSAVKCFYEALLKVNTSEVCGNDPTSTSYGGSAQIRLGFVPYAVNVNVGKLLPNEYLADSWYYQTRKANTAVPPRDTETYWEIYGGGSISQADCLRYMNNEAFGHFSPTPATSGGPNPQPTVESSFPSDGAASTGDYGEWGWSRVRNSWSAAEDTSGNDRTCRRKRTDVTTYYVPKFASWTYNKFELDVSQLKAGESSWNDSFTAPVGDTAFGEDVATATINWDGCIEERPTFRNTDGDPTNEWDPIPASALDMNIDLVPNDAIAGSKWGPMLPGLVWGRYTGSGNTTNAVTTANNLDRKRSYYCPNPARKLKEYNTVGDLMTYINSLRADGMGTYHDIGMLWGARMLSPTGIFANENALTEEGGAIQRHLIFMTDGDAQAFTDNLYAYGLPWWDRKQTSYVADEGDLESLINTRLEALCTAVKNMNITLWVISYGNGVNEDNEERLEQCATDEDHYFDSEDREDLIDDFTQIANEIADLRLTS